jgi:photosystem II stability/assembly factor-like uncharacterized protein
MPPALPGEGAFAASGTCLVARGEGSVWFGTGGAEARIFRSTDRGRSWTVANVPIQSGNASSGVFSLAFRDERQGVAVGGDYKRPEEAGRCVAFSADGGRTWTLSPGADSVSYRSAVAYVPGALTPTVICVGPAGSDLSIDGGQTWARVSATGFHALSFPRLGRAGWAVGEAGQIAKWPD